MIRFTPDLNSEINRVVSKFNSKVNRLMKQNATRLPSLVDESVLKSKYIDRKLLLRELKQLEDFTKPGAEEIITSFSDAIGALFKTHKEYSMEIAKKMVTDVLPKYFKEDASNFEKKMGLFIMDDMVEFLGQELLAPIWPDISKTLIAYTDHQSCDLKTFSKTGNTLLLCLLK